MLILAAGSRRVTKVQPNHLQGGTNEMISECSILRHSGVLQIHDPRYYL